MIWQNDMIWRKMCWVALNDNENEKMLGPHALLCAHAIGDTPSSSIYYGHVCY